MDELEIRRMLLEKWFILRDCMEDLRNEAEYQSRWNPRIHEKRQYLASRMDFLMEILEDLEIEIPEWKGDDVNA